MKMISTKGFLKYTRCLAHVLILSAVAGAYPAFAQGPPHHASAAPSDTDSTDSIHTRMETKAETDPVLVFLNHWSTNEDVLLYDVGLTSSQGDAVIIAAAKAGPDLISGTIDDTSFANRASVLSLPFIHEDDLEKIEDFAVHRWDSGAIPVHYRVVRFINSPFATFDILVENAGLPSAAATAILDIRDGADGIFGTPDDRPFMTVEEIDDIRGIGPSSIIPLRNFAARFRVTGGADIFRAKVDFREGKMKFEGTLTLPPHLTRKTVNMEAGVFLMLGNVQLREIFELRGKRRADIWKFNADADGKPPFFVRSFKIIWVDAGNKTEQNEFELEVKFNPDLFPARSATMPQYIEVAVRLACDPLIVNDAIGDDEYWHNIENDKWGYKKFPGGRGK